MSLWESLLLRWCSSDIGFKPRKWAWIGVLGMQNIPKFCIHSWLWQVRDLAIFLCHFRNPYLHLGEWLLSCAAPCLLTSATQTTLWATACLASHCFVTLTAYGPEMWPTVLFCGAWWPHHQLISHHIQRREKACVAELWQKNLGGLYHHGKATRAADMVAGTMIEYRVETGWVVLDLVSHHVRRPLSESQQNSFRKYNNPHSQQTSSIYHLPSESNTLMPQEASHTSFLSPMKAFKEKHCTYQDGSVGLFHRKLPALCEKGKIVSGCICIGFFCQVPAWRP